MAKYIILNGKVYYIKLASNIISLFEELSHLTSSLRHPKIFIKEFGDFLMPCHQHCLSVYILVQR